MPLHVETVHNAVRWPDQRPYSNTWLDGWNVHHKAWGNLLSGVVSPVLIEVGAWMGRTSATLLHEYVDLRLVAIDLWKPEGFWQERMLDAQKAGQLPDDRTIDPLLQYQTNLWAYRNRIQCVQADSVAGMMQCAGVKPTIVYLDADHSYNAIRKDIDTATDLWPNAIICGDDYEDRQDGKGTGVKRAVHEVAQEIGANVITYGRFWRYA